MDLVPTEAHATICYLMGLLENDVIEFEISDLAMCEAMVHNRLRTEQSKLLMQYQNMEQKRVRI